MSLSTSTDDVAESDSACPISELSMHKSAKNLRAISAHAASSKECWNLPKVFHDTLSLVSIILNHN